MNELSTWLNLKSFIDGYDIFDTMSFENLLITDCDFRVQYQLSKNPFLYNRAMNYIREKRMNHIKHTLFEEE